LAPTTQKIENKFLDALCGYYGKDDEDDLPQEIQEISLGEMFESDKSPAEMRARIVSEKGGWRKEGGWGEGRQDGLGACRN
jgi:hypothetical protein